MPLHDWTKVGAFAFNGFHTSWLAFLKGTLNHGVLPPGYYADAEQITTRGKPTDRTRPDVLALQRPRPTADAGRPDSGGVLLEEASPAARRVLFEVAARPRRHLVIRHASGYRVVALIELVSWANKDRPAHVQKFAQRVAAALTQGVCVLVLDPFPPGRHDPNGFHDAIVGEFGPETYTLPSAGVRTFASYASPGESYLEHPAVGVELPTMPLFLSAERYVNVPLEPSYQRAWNDTPDVYREILDPPSGGDRPQE